MPRNASAANPRSFVGVSNAPECNRAGNGSCPGAHGTTVISAMNDPFPIGRLSRDNANVVAPDDNHSNSRSAGVRTFAGPLSGKRKAAVRFAEISAHVISAPSVRSVRMLISVIGASVGVDDEHAQQSCRESGWLNHSVLQLQFGFIEATKNRLSNARRDLWFRKMTPAIAWRGGVSFR
jgi:hypothetical protein